MWVVDIDPETEILCYLTLTYDRATATATTRLMAQTDLPCYHVADWPASDVAFSMVDDVLTLYPAAPVNAQSFVGLTPTYVVPSDTKTRRPTLVSVSPTVTLLLSAATPSASSLPLPPCVLL